MHLPKDLTQDVITRLKSIEGQVRGITSMLEEDVDPEKILIQIKAADKALQKAHYLLLDDAYRKALAIKIVNAADACPGNCGNEDKINYIKKEFPHLHLDELSQKLKEMKDIEDRIEQYNKDNQGEN